MDWSVIGSPASLGGMFPSPEPNALVAYWCLSFHEGMRRGVAIIVPDGGLFSLTICHHCR
jgi:hypothetical protein